MDTSFKKTLVVMATAAFGLAGIGCGGGDEPAAESTAGAEQGGAEGSCGAGSCGGAKEEGAEGSCGAGSCGGNAEGGEGAAEEGAAE